MPQHIKIHTDFDITETGVVRNYKEGILPRKVRGVIISSEEEWIKCRVVRPVDGNTPDTHVA